jgi:hypothetical protein
MFGRRWWPSVIAAIAVGALLLPAAAFATNTSNDANPYLRMGVGARALGMGGAFVGVADDVTANVWNPAGLGYATGTQLHATIAAGMNVDRKMNYFAASHAWDWGTLALGWINSGTSDIPFANSVGAGSGDFNYNDNAILLSYARNFDMVSAGLTGKLLFTKQNSGFGNNDGYTGYGLDVGVSARLTDYLKLGVAIQDLATKSGSKDDPTNTVPANLRAGLAAVPVDGLTLAVDMEKMRDNDNYIFHVGGEYMMTLGDNFMAGPRLGLDDGRFAGGIGFRISMVDIDYAYVVEPQDFLDESHRISLGLALGREPWTSGKPKISDRDMDGIPDAMDKCPDQAEDFDGYEDTDGCPDPDNDGDGILDVNDKCPNQAEDFDGYQDEDGCPDVDNDGDGILDVDDKCPNAKETFNGYQDTDGCPDEAPLYFPMAWINFKFGTSEIVGADPIPVLEEVARIMNEHPDVQVEIDGHTDNIGSDDANMALGLKRAQSVKQYLVNKGISGDRLITKSFGESKPIDTNDTELGRARNRRIEFHQIMK